MRLRNLGVVLALALLSTAPAARADVVDLRSDSVATWYGGVPLEEIGWSVGAGDLDGDGVKDMIFTAAAASPLNRSHAGEVYVVWGGPPRYPPTSFLEANTHHDVFVAGAIANGELGYSIAIGDVDGDGKEDVLVGERGGLGPTGLANTGRAWLIWGDERPTIGSTLDLAAPDSRVLKLVGVDVSDMAGYNVTLLDWNDDLLSDIVVSAPYAAGPNNNRNDCGELYVVYGRSRASLGASLDLGTQADVRIYGPTSPAEAGISVGGGDMDGDGTDDLLIGAPRAPGFTGQVEAGQVRVLFGPGPAPGTILDLATTSGMRFYGEVVLSRLGGVVPMPFQQRCVTGMDWNGDGRDEILMAAPQGDFSGNSDIGVIYLYFGAPRESLPAQVNLLTTSTVQLVGPDAGAWAGLCMIGHDLDSDGFQDLIVTAPRADGPDGRTQCGSVFVVHGRPRAVTPPLFDLATDADRRYIGADSDDLTGIYAYPGDLDGDLIPDLLFSGCSSAGPGNSIPIAGECYLDYGAGEVGLPLPRAGGPALRLASRHPARGALALALELPARSEVRVEVHDLQGRHIATLLRGGAAAGVTPLNWLPARDGAAPGLYFVTAHTPGGGSARLRVVVLE